MVKHKTKSLKTYKELKDELDNLIVQLNSSDTDLDQLIKIYSQAQEKIDQLKKYLEEQENVIKILS